MNDWLVRWLVGGGWGEVFAGPGWISAYGLRGWRFSGLNRGLIAFP